MKELERIRHILKECEDSLSELLKEGEESSKKCSKREASLLDEIEKTRIELDSKIKEIESLKEQALEAQKIIEEFSMANLELKKEVAGLEHCLKELKKKEVMQAQKKVDTGKYRLPPKKPLIQPKKGFRIKEE